MPPKNAYSETTPLLWPQQPQFSDSGPWPAPHQFPANYQPGNWQAQYMQQGSSSRPFQYMRWGGQGQGSSQDNPKKILHDGDLGKDPHSQFCALTGCPPTNAPPDFRYRPSEKTLYGRAVYQVQSQNLTYQLTAAATNTLLLLQIVLGAALTGLGGADIPRWVITLFGAANTIIAGLVAYLKSRGQPMRARMFRDDLERVVDEIENSEVMWLGISKNVHGYSDIDTDGDVTVRSEVARLTRLLDKAIKSNNQNNPDLYSSHSSTESTGTTSRNNQFLTLPSIVDTSQVPAAPQPQAKDDTDQAPATLKRTKTDDKKPADDKKASDDKKAPEMTTTTPAAPVSAPPPTTDKGKAAETSSGNTTTSGGTSSGNNANDGNTKTSNTTTTTGTGGNTTTTTTSSSSKQTYASTAAAAKADDPDASPATAAVTHKKSQPEGGPKKEAGEPDEIF